MLTIRLARVGKRNQPQFKIALQEHTIAPGGRHVEILGSYNPFSKTAVLKEERIKYWISQGVNISDTVYNLFVSKGLIAGEKRKVKLPKKQEETKEETKEEEPIAAAEKPETAETKEEIKKEKTEESVQPGEKAVDK